MLDFTQVMPHIVLFAGDQARVETVRQNALDESARRLQAAVPRWQEVQAKITASRTSWLVAGWQEPPDGVAAPPACPPTSVVYAADGSQIVGDRHDIAFCYLLNIGRIALRYGTGEDALLDSRATLARPEDDLLDAFEEEPTILPRRLALRRQLAELAALAELIEAAPDNRPALALHDGSLILWPLVTETESFRDDCLNDFHVSLEIARGRNAPLVGYISQSEARDVVNSLRIARCPHEEAHCERLCPGHDKPRPLYKAPPCAGAERVRDIDLFASRLRPGERSAVFGAQSSKILRKYTPEQQIHFFYLNTGQEIARIELPQWVAQNADLLAQTHALCWDQACKGDGYPVALAEAHEQAVVRGPERDAFFYFLQQAFVQSKIRVDTTQKARAKRARRV